MSENTLDNQQEGEEQLFTQEQVNRIVQKRVAKYADYDELKAKAAQLDEMQEQSKSAVDSLTARIEQTEKELAQYRQREERESMIKAVSDSTGVDRKYVEMLSGTTVEELTEQANAIKPNFASAITSDTGKNPDNGDPESDLLKFTKELFK